ncbi:MAG: hypothetical protein GOV15_02420 [Candidatus Diapherotrites archaeon]|nr:hypothetical protein [Candidatus Diapherotrites archaeon]
MDLLLAAVWDDVRLALTLLFFILILNWSKQSMGSKTAVVFAGVLTYLTFFKHPSLVWLMVLVYFAGTGIFNSFLKAVEGIK